LKQPKKPPVENDSHRKAFEDYYAMGGRRKYQLLADKLGVSYSTVKNWSLSFGWKQRVAKRDAEAASQARDKSMFDAVEERARHRIVVRGVIAKLTKLIFEGNTKLIKELEKCIKLLAYLDGQPDPGKPGRSNEPPSNVHIYIPDNGRGPKPPPTDVGPPNDGSRA
jgi:hypothetical protein